MFEFLAALFGGLFWYGKFESEKKATQRFEDKANAMINKIEDTRKKYSDFDIDNEMTSYVSNPDNYDYIRKSLISSYRRCYGENDVSGLKEMLLFVLPENYSDGSTVDRTCPISMLLRILFASEGRYLYWDTMGYIDMLKDPKLLLKYFKWVNLELKRNNMPEQFVFVATHYPTYYESRAYTLDAVDYVIDDIKMGEFMLKSNCTYKINR